MNPAKSGTNKERGIDMDKKLKKQKIAERALSALDRFKEEIEAGK